MAVGGEVRPLVACGWLGAAEQWRCQSAVHYRREAEGEQGSNRAGEQAMRRGESRRAMGAAVCVFRVTRFHDLLFAILTYIF